MRSHCSSLSRMIDIVIRSTAVGNFETSNTSPAPSASIAFASCARLVFAPETFSAKTFSAPVALNVVVEHQASVRLCLLGHIQRSLFNLHHAEGFPWAIYGLAFHFVHDICTAKVLATQHFFRCANLSSAAQFLLSWGSQIATCNETVVVLSGEGDDLRMIVNVSIGCDGDLTGLNMRQLDPFAHTAAA